MTDCLSKDERFESVEKFVHKIVWAFRRKYGLDVDDLQAEAYYGYMQADQSYDGRAEFITWVGEKVKRRLQTYVRKVYSERRGVELDLTIVPERPADPGFVLDEFFRTLQPDAQELVRLTLDSPFPVLATMAEIGETPANYRYALRTWLKDCGWAAARVAQAFADVKEAL